MIRLETTKKQLRSLYFDGFFNTAVPFLPSLLSKFLIHVFFLYFCVVFVPLVCF